MKQKGRDGIFEKRPCIRKAFNERKSIRKTFNEIKKSIQ